MSCRGNLRPGREPFRQYGTARHVLLHRAQDAHLRSTSTVCCGTLTLQHHEAADIGEEMPDRGTVARHPRV